MLDWLLADDGELTLLAEEELELETDDGLELELVLDWLDGELALLIDELELLEERLLDSELTDDSLETEDGLDKLLEDSEERELRLDCEETEDGLL